MLLYVDGINGNNKNFGTQASPWKTIQYAVKTANPGDTIYVMGGTYNERVILNKSGADGNPITIKNYDDQEVIIDGTGITWWSNTFSALFQINGQSNWTVEGIHLINSYSQGFGDDYTDSSVGARSHNVTIRNCSVHTSGGCGVFFVRSKNILLDGLELIDTTINLSDECITIATCKDFEIKNCRVIDGHKEGINAKDGCKNGKIHHNYVDNAWGVGIYSDAFSLLQSNIEIYENTIVNSPVGISTGAEYGGNLENVLIHNNIIYDCQRGINITANDLYNKPHTISGITVKNNVTFNITLTGVWLTSVLQDILVENNILFTKSSQYGIFIGSEINGIQMDLNEVTIRNNFYRDDKGPPPYLNHVGTNYLTLLATAGSNSAYTTVFKDPSGTITGTRDFTLTNNSPAIGAGYGGVDMGAFTNTIKPPATTLKTVVYDSFDRADNATSLGTANSGQKWSIMDGKFGIKSKKAYLVSDAISYYNIAVIDPGHSDCIISLDVQYYPNQSAGIGFRVSNQTTFLHCVIDSTGMNVKKFSNFTSKTIGTPYAFTPVNGTTYKISLKIKGNSIIASLDGVERIFIIDSFNTTQTKLGLRVPTGFNIKMDNFKVEVETS